MDQRFGCAHYKSRCKLRCAECLEFFSCRFCHDDVKYYAHELDANSDEYDAEHLYEKDMKKGHLMDRHAVTEIMCNECGKIQAPSQSCVSCKIEFAGYFCDICNLFDDDYE